MEYTKNENTKSDEEGEYTYTGSREYTYTAIHRLYYRKRRYKGNNRKNDNWRGSRF